MKPAVKILCCLFLLLAFKAQAAGISVTPSQLYFEQAAGVKKTDFFEVTNLSAEPAIFSLYADEFSDQISLEPDNFRLEPNEAKKVRVIVNFGRVGIFATNLSVVAQDLDRRKFNVSTGVKLPVQIKAAEGQSKPWLVKAAAVFGFLLAMAFVVIVTVRQRRKRWYEKAGDSVNLLIHRHKPWWERIIKF